MEPVARTVLNEEPAKKKAKGDHRTLASPPVVKVTMIDSSSHVAIVHELDTIFMLKEKIEKVTGVRRATQIWHSSIKSNGGDFGDGNPLNDEDSAEACGLGQGSDVICTLSANHLT
jgi:hypothetical protein